MKITLIRTSLIIVVIASAAVISLQMNQLKNKLTTYRDQAMTQAAAHQKAEADLVKARLEVEKTALTLRKTAAALEAKNVEVATQAQQMTKLTSEAQKLHQERDDAQAELSAFRVSMPSPELVANAAKHIKTLQDSVVALNDENAILARCVKNLRKYGPAGDRILLPSDLRAKVLVVDPKWHFVVLDAGEEQGMLPHAELLVNRGGKLVAKVIVKSVEKNRCVADLVADWDLVDVLEGDRAIPAYPQS